jgi:hypothetical protein
MTGRTSSRIPGWLAPTAAVLAFGLALAACGGSSSPSASNTTTTSSTTTTTSAPGASGETVTGLSSLAANGKDATFAATYTYKEGTTTETMTIAQQPPDSLFKISSGGFDLTTASKSYYCSASTCVSSTTADPLSSLLFLFDGQTFEDTVAAYATLDQTQLAAEGVTLSFSTGTYAGQPSKCITIHTTSTGTSSSVWCVASNGVLDYWIAGTTSFTLTSFTSSPPSSDFTLPAGVTITTT